MKQLLFIIEKIPPQGMNQPWTNDSSVKTLFYE